MTTVERVSFFVEGIEIAGVLRLPEGGTGPVAGLVFTGPFTGVKEQVTGTYAARLAELGFATLAFDHRNWGESGGAPRQHEDPQGKLADLRAAVSLLRSRPEVDAARIGAVGICLGGGYALKFAAFDPRVKAFAGIAGAYNSPYAMRAGFGPEGYRQALAGFVETLERQDGGGDVEYLPAVAEEGEAAMGGAEPFAYYGTERSAAEHWRNRVTRASVREMVTVDNMAGADFLGPTPGLIVHGVEDAYCSPEGAKEAYERMADPKEIVWLDAKLHVDLYDGEPYVTQAVDATARFLREHLAR
ncbi:alpha/beta hydrolase [Yinghuangia seranimata]|uniref:alpha/beta hydrolase n=1 Tax=Yinghuangia seranimata TaxID=408067 RepID=UPI00248B919B|nr:alpha/beta hydrolase [Yinghuangia seranimata]MDI2131456.1 alpha/beta hydrolase [Yinghuangia seranimata]